MLDYYDTQIAAEDWDAEYHWERECAEVEFEMDRESDSILSAVRAADKRYPSATLGEFEAAPWQS